MLKRSAGVLINVSTLPSRYGIGGFGQEIEKCADFLTDCGCRIWQVLPLTTIGLGNSPYSGNSAFALNFLYVDPDTLFNEGYITEEEKNEAVYNGTPYVVDYGAVFFLKDRVLRQAYARKGEEVLDKLKKYLKSNAWVYDFALYMTIKEKFNNSSWLDWPKEYKFRENVDEKAFIESNNKEFYFYVFSQYILSEQWSNWKKYLNKRGIQVIGDMPMYVSLDSSDVWANRKNYQLKVDGTPKKVAGVPPDYFSENGQLWGNPLYDYKYMGENKFKWWLERIDRMMEIYDILRIDHFRAFSEYWAVPAEAETAKEGKWCKGVGNELFELIFKKYPKDRFIAQDLGIIDNKVVKLLKKTGLPGMRVMQFGYGDLTNIHTPCNYVKNCIGYTGTHDNNTSLGYLWELDEATRSRVLEYIGCDKNVWGRGAYDNISVKLMIKKLMESECQIAIVPLQDLFGFGSDCRMNTPGVANGNWQYRATQDQLDSCRKQYYKDLNIATGRF